MTQTIKKTLALLRGAILALHERRLDEARDRLAEAEAHITTAQLTETAPDAQSEDRPV